MFTLVCSLCFVDEVLNRSNLVGVVLLSLFERESEGTLVPGIPADPVGFISIVFECGAQVLGVQMEISVLTCRVPLPNSKLCGDSSVCKGLA